MPHSQLTAYGKKIMDQIRSLGSHKLSCDEMVRSCFQILRNEVAFDAAVYLFFEPKTCKIVGAVLENIDSKYLGPLLRNIQTESNSAIKVFGKDFARRGLDLLPYSSYAASPFYQHVLKPNNLFFSLVGRIDAPCGASLGQYYLWRSEGARNFSKLDLAIAEEFSPVLGELLSKNQDADPALPTVIDIVKQRSCPGILVYDAADRVIYQNSEAREIEALIRDGGDSNHSNGNGTADPFATICGNLKEHVAQRKAGSNGSSDITHVYSFGGESFCFRGVVLANNRPKIGSLFLMLIEGVSKDKLKINQLLSQCHLSPREIAVVKLILLGKTNKEIARDLGVGEHTIKDHVRRVMNRLGVTTRTGIISHVFGINASFSNTQPPRSNSATLPV